MVSSPFLGSIPEFPKCLLFSECVQNLEIFFSFPDFENIFPNFDNFFLEFDKIGSEFEEKK